MDMSASEGWRSEQELVKACLAGDVRATHRLVATFHREVYALCLRLLGHTHDAEDVTQEVFLRIFRSLRSWDGKRPLRPLDTGNCGQSLSHLVAQAASQ
jgi:DNA-directed RNA polymerase specialized sigma24 family protein